MGKWNEQAAANNNLPSQTIRSSEMLLGGKANHEFTEELSDGGERDQNIQILENSPKNPAR
ncbi:hypothetical protein BIV60_10805 [Bacillus sp. MUM 116]|uniref:hypothetical protein n=1 Tax=Bacillus sp. MUM 116 TaxID=1678002 RepID=UPI0008F5E715|nr:hypothetical protein [Bacillus sp. MUM 116]OIK15012.1 hypothetical protein BIV60_10805 [Bacillus sp. MUM 116]